MDDNVAVDTVDAADATDGNNIVYSCFARTLWLGLTAFFKIHTQIVILSTVVGCITIDKQ